jgi:hypothetical protein
MIALAPAMPPAVPSLVVVPMPSLVVVPQVIAAQVPAPGIGKPRQRTGPGARASIE